MFSEADYVSLKGLKNRSPEEETLWQSVRKERRSIQQAEAKRMKRAAATEEEKDAREGQGQGAAGQVHRRGNRRRHPEEHGAAAAGQVQGR